MKEYIRLILYLKPRVRIFALAILCMTVTAGTHALLALLVKPVLDDIFIAKNIFMLKVIPLAIVFTYVLKGLSDFGHTYIMDVLGQEVVMRLRNELYQKLHTLPMGFFTKSSTGELVSHIMNDVNFIRESVTKGLASLVKDSLTVVALFGVIFYRDWFLALVVTFVFPLSVCPLVRYGRRFRKISRKNFEKIADLSAILCETIAGIRVVKAFCMEAFEIKKFVKQNQKLFHIIKRAGRIDAIVSPVMEVLGAVTGGIVIWIWGKQVIEGRLTPGTFFSFMAAVFMLYKPLKTLSKVNNLIQQALAAAHRIFNILDTKPTLVEASPALVLPPIRHSIVFDNVWFSYGPLPLDKSVLKDVSFSVDTGQVVALAGKSGAGKTTLVNLIPRFYDPCKGMIFIDGHDIKKVSILSLRRQTALVTQETVLFNDTVFNNIAYGNPNAEKDSVISAASSAFAHDFVQALPEGYDTVVGEMGVNLSGGQRQRIAIARAIFKNAPILILDEATSELDSESERYVQKALVNLMRGRTTFIIAHRFSSIVNADRILVLENGCIVEDGKHDVLMSSNGVYADLYRMQAVK